MQTAYLTFTHPALSQTFVVDEVRALRQLGMRIDMWGLRPAKADALQTERNREEASASRTLIPVKPWPTLRGHARALAASPSAYLATAWRALSDRPPGLRALAMAAGTFLAAIRLWAELDRGDIRHLHVHFAGTPTHVAALVTHFANRARGDGGPWTWSVTLHGPVEFEDLTGLRLTSRVRDATFVATISDFARSQVLSLVPTDQWDKVRVVPCGIDLSHFPAPAERAGEGETTILYVGTLIPRKGQPVLLEAFAGVLADGHDAQLVLVGDGPERPALERLAERLGIADQVRFAGGLGHDDVRRAFAEADVFCLPSFAEGVPVVLMEAMASGLPVVTTRIAGVSELVGDGAEGLLVRPGNVGDLQGALSHFVADPEARRQAGERGRARVVERHDIAVNAAKLLELHREFRREHA